MSSEGLPEAVQELILETATSISTAIDTSLEHQLQRAIQSLAEPERKAASDAGAATSAPAPAAGEGPQHKMLHDFHNMYQAAISSVLETNLRTALEALVARALEQSTHEPRALTAAGHSSKVPGTGASDGNGNGNSRRGDQSSPGISTLLAEHTKAVVRDEETQRRVRGEVQRRSSIPSTVDPARPSPLRNMSTAGGAGTAGIGPSASAGAAPSARTSLRGLGATPHSRRVQPSPCEHDQSSSTSSGGTSKAPLAGLSSITESVGRGARRMSVRFFGGSSRHSSPAPCGGSCTQGKGLAVPAPAEDPTCCKPMQAASLLNNYSGPDRCGGAPSSSGGGQHGKGSLSSKSSKSSGSSTSRRSSDVGVADPPGEEDQSSTKDVMQSDRAIRRAHELGHSSNEALVRTSRRRSSSSSSHRRRGSDASSSSRMSREARWEEMMTGPPFSAAPVRSSVESVEGGQADDPLGSAAAIQSGMDEMDSFNESRRASFQQSTKLGARDGGSNSSRSQSPGTPEHGLGTSPLSSLPGHLDRRSRASNESDGSSTGGSSINSSPARRRSAETSYRKRSSAEGSDTASTRAIPGMQGRSIAELLADQLQDDRDTDKDPADGGSDVWSTQPISHPADFIAPSAGFSNAIAQGESDDALDNLNDAHDESGNGTADFHGQLRRRQALATRCHACISGDLRWLPMLEPLSRARLAWEVVMTATCLVTLAIMPVCWAFRNVPRGMHLAMGSVCTPVFGANILVVLRTAIPRQGMLTRDPRTVARSYFFSSRFVADVLATLTFPLQMLISVHVAPLYLVVLKHLLGALRTYERATKAAHAKRRVMMLFLFSFVQIHWMACVWSLLADPEEEIRASLRGLDPKNASADEMPQSWFTSYAATIHAPPPNSDGLQYIYSIYFTLATTTTIGFGDVVPANEVEVTVMCFTICVSALLYSSLIAYISNLILASDVNWTAHKQKVETIKSYMRHRKIPKDLQGRIEEYLEYLWTTQKGFDEEDITSMLPETLRQQISLFCNSRIISTVPLFANVPAHVCAAIVMQLQPRVFVPDDEIIRRGDWADEMFLVYRGVVRLVELSEQQGRGVYLKDGDYFGEVAVLTGGRRMMSIRAVTYCHLYSLKQKLLERILQEHPECIDHLLVNMMDAYDNFEQIKAQIISLAEGTSR